MASTTGDYQLAAAAAGFTLGFGVLTVWKAVGQTRQNKSPLQSVYIYMLWGEILSNLVIGILGWLFLNGVLSGTAMTLFWILFCYVFEVQLLLQIIINRIAVFTERRSTATYLKWGTAAIITCINIAVFIIWVPAHMTVPHTGPKVFININTYWDRMSKVLICLVDAALNWYFIHVVSARLVKHHGLKKYRSLVTYYTRLGIVSVAMDVMLIGLMSLPNPVVYIQFHPIAYMVKLNIEMSMADLIVKIARNSEIDVNPASSSIRPYPDTKSASRIPHTNANGHDYVGGQTSTVHAGHEPSALQAEEGRAYDGKGIQRQTEVQVYVHDSDNDSFDTDPKQTTSMDVDSSKNTLDRTQSRHSDGSQIPLKEMHPRQSYPH